MTRRASPPGGGSSTTRAASPAAAVRPLPAGRLLIVAAAVGLTAGVAEFLWVLQGLRLGFHVRLSAHYVWMIPAGVVLCTVAAILALLVIGLWWRRARSPRVVAGVLVTLAAAELLRVVGQLHWVAVGLLALGIGMAVSRAAEGRAARLLYRAAPAVSLVLTAVVALLGTSMVRALRGEERAALAALPVPHGDMPNVLLLILDTVRSLEAADDAELMPNLARYAHRGVYFERAIAPSPWTLPSHASMFTGRWASELSAGWQAPLDRRYPTLAEALADKGYLTAGFVANLMFATRGTGLGRGFVHYDDYPVNLGQTLLSVAIGRWLAGNSTLRRIVGYHELLNRRTAADITDAFLEWERRGPRQPYFAFVNFFDAHEPYFPPGYAGSALWPGRRWSNYLHMANLPTGESAWVREKWKLSAAETAIHASGYRAAVRRVDGQFGRLLDDLDRRGVLDHTVVIIAGDHGEQLGEHGLFEHNNSLYLPTLHVPLLILPPGGTAGPVRVPEVVSLRNIPATVLDMVGGSRSPFPGRSLVPFWRAQGDTASVVAVEDTAFAHLAQGIVRQPWYPIGRGTDMYSLTTSAHHYIRNGDGSEELYDWESDPAESRNLIARPEAFVPAMRLRQTLDALLGGR